MAGSTVETAILGVLADANIGLSRRVNLFRGPVRPPLKNGSNVRIPHEVVFCMETGGLEPISFLNANNGTDLRTTFLQVRVRSNINEYGAGRDLAENVWKALQRAEPTGCISVTCREASPVYLGQDDTEHHEWSTNITVVRRD